MSVTYLRVYQKCDYSDVEKHLLVFGDLTGSCESCKAINIKLESNICPECKTEFKYLSFRHVKSNYPKIQKMSEQRPSLKIIDYDDYVKGKSGGKFNDLFK